MVQISSELTCIVLVIVSSMVRRSSGIFMKKAFVLLSLVSVGGLPYCWPSR